MSERFSEPFEFYKTLKPDILYDYARSGYYHDYMRGILIALSEGVNVVGCLAWSIVDNLGEFLQLPFWFLNDTLRCRYGRGEACG